MKSRKLAIGQVMDRFIFYGIVLIICLIALYMPDFSDQLTLDQARRGITNWLLSNDSCDSIHSIIERKGDDAGEIGYFYVDMEKGDSLLVPADARFKIMNCKDRSYLDYYVERAFAGRPPRYDNSVFLRVVSFYNWILHRKNENQKWWDCYLENH
jgi:hypothetical protein